MGIEAPPEAKSHAERIKQLASLIRNSLLDEQRVRIPHIKRRAMERLGLGSLTVNRCIATFVDDGFAHIEGDELVRQ